ncbi:MAG TPA: HlyD family efflux transporter periplasmic adaptor subunit [Gemmataceae bacterium]|nr:HlyD family efflux transporter periplasmic adaptor subunit [Gemmataceae bacterium]
MKSATGSLWRGLFAAAVTLMLLGPAPAADDVVLEAKGYVVPARQVQVSPSVPGKIVWLHEKFEEGQRFKQGEVLARLEDDEYKADFDKAKAAVDRARARFDGLDKAATPQQRAVAKADVEEAEAGLRKAKWRLENCTIRAPISGTLLTKKTELGNLVSPTAYQLSASLGDMADLADLRVDINIADLQIAKLAVGQNCTVMPEIFGTDPTYLKKHRGGYKATLDRILPVADRAKGSLTVRLKIDKAEIPPEEEGVYLKPEMSVLVWFKKGN